MKKKILIAAIVCFAAVLAVAVGGLFIVANEIKSFPDFEISSEKSLTALKY